ncbi:MAG: hypothetical protein ACSLFR_04225 [Solirubrobacteraceae bacterium]
MTVANVTDTTHDLHDPLVEPYDTHRVCDVLAMERTVDHPRSIHDGGQDGWVVQHIQADDTAARLLERGRDIFETEPVWVGRVGPVIGAHVGPGPVGVGGIPRRMVA